MNVFAKCRCEGEGEESMWLWLFCRCGGGLGAVVVVVVVVGVNGATARVDDLHVSSQLLPTGHYYSLVLPGHPAVTPG